MEIAQSIKRQEQKLARLEHNLALQRYRRRKAETRQKIELGGLVIKAKMDQYPKSVILGALLDACKAIETDEDQKKLFRLKGEAVFMEHNNE